MRRWVYGMNSGCSWLCCCSFRYMFSMHTATPGRATTKVRIFQVLAATRQRQTRSDWKNDTSVRRGKFWLQIKTAQILFQLLKLEDFLLFVSVTETDVKYFLCTSWNLYHQTLCGVWGLPERLRWWMMFSRGSEKGSRWRQIFRFLSQRTKNISHVSRWNLTDRTFTLESGRCVKVRLCSVVRLTSTHQINKRSVRREPHMLIREDWRSTDQWRSDIIWFVVNLSILMSDDIVHILRFTLLIC